MRYTYTIFILGLMWLLFFSTPAQSQPYPTFQDYLNGNSPLVGKYKHPYRIWETGDVRTNLRFSNRMGRDGRLRMSRPSLQYHFANLDYFYNVANPNTFDYDKRPLNIPKGSAVQSTHLEAPSTIRRKQDFLQSMVTPPLKVNFGTAPKPDETEEPVDLSETINVEASQEEAISRSRSPYELLMEEARDRINKRQYKSAATQLESLTRLQTENVELHRDYGLSLFLSGEYEKASKFLQLYLQNRGNDALQEEIDITPRVAQDYQFHKKRLQQALLNDPENQALLVLSRILPDKIEMLF